MMIDDLVKDAQYCFLHGCTVSGIAYIDRIKEQLSRMSEKDKILFEHKNEVFYRRYIQPREAHGCYEVE